MSSVTVDLRAVVVPADLKIWRLFPGRSYSVLNDFRNTDTAFLDLPALPLPDGPLGEDGPPDLDDRILLSSAWNRWAKEARGASKQKRPLPPKPSSDPAAYADEPRRSFIANRRGAILGLFERAQRGDLLVVPDKPTSRKLLVGEFLGSPEERVLVRVDHYVDALVPARRVKWIDEINELEVSSRVSEVVRRPNPFVAFDRTLYAEIFDRAYGTYVHGKHFTGRFETGAMHFMDQSGFDFFVLASAIARYVEAVDAGETAFKSGGSLVHVAASARSEPYRMDTAVNINSPGAFLLRSTKLAPLVLAAVLAVAASSNAADGPPAVAVTNSRGADVPVADVCAAEVQEKTRRVLSLMGMTEWREACERSRRLQDNARLRGSARVQQDGSARQIEGRPRQP